MKKSIVDGAWIMAVIDAPLVGYSNGADPLFGQYVAHIPHPDEG